MHNLALDASQVNRVVEGANDPVIAVAMSVNSISCYKKNKTDPWGRQYLT